MGKTYISSMLGKDYDNVIILSPTRALAQQNLEKFKEYLKTAYNYILISIDGKTNIDEIDKILKSKNIISSTYDSCDIINLLIAKLKKCYIIIDEFHNFSENNINDTNNQINKLINYNANKVFISATPIKNFMNLEETNIYTYKWEDAINNKYICDFNIYLPYQTEELINFLNIIKNNYNEMEIKLIKKAYNLVKSMLFNGDKKCICYLTTIEKATVFNKILDLISNTFNIEINREQIDCNTKKLKRNEIIEKFKNATGLFILLNVHVLDEGIDIPECDSVYITQPNNNIINIVQRMCRANRIYKNKTECNIYLWCSEKKTNNILSYIFDKMDKSIKNKINKILINNTQKVIVEFEKTQKIDIINTANINTDFLKNILMIIDSENNMWFGLRTILQYLNYISIDKTIHTMNKDNIKKYGEINVLYKYNISKIQKTTYFINEHELYKLLIKSNKPSSHIFINNYFTNKCIIKDEYIRQTNIIK
jgi:ERCC4-related helicase